MSAGKNPYQRYVIIDQCLSSKTQRYWKAEELMNKLRAHDLPVELRSLMYDLKYMRENLDLGHDAPIAYCRRNKGYYYTENGYTIYGKNISPNELMAFDFIVGMNEQFQDTAFVQQARATLAKLSKAARATRMHRTPERLTGNTPHPYYKGLGYLSVLAEAIFQRKVLRITYQKFEAEQRGDHIIHPYYLKTYNNRWYIFGLSEKRNEIIPLGLDRINSVQEEPKAYRDDAKQDDNEYFFHTLGITRGRGPVEDIELQFTPSQGHYVKTLHLHHTQEILKDDKESLVVRLRLIQNYELYQLIMSFMDQVKVLKPTSLQQHIGDMIAKMLLMYKQS